MATINTIAVVDPASSGFVFCALALRADVRVVRVNSVPVSAKQAAFLPPDLRDLVFTGTHTYADDLPKLLEELRPYQIRAVFAGSEPGVMFTDVLSEALGVYTNGAALRQCRRNKFAMQEQLKKAGVRSIHQMSVDEKSLKADILVRT
jgi:hypothetical protein